MEQILVLSTLALRHPRSLLPLHLLHLHLSPPPPLPVLRLAVEFYKSWQYLARPAPAQAYSNQVLFSKNSSISLTYVYE